MAWCLRANLWRQGRGCWKNTTNSTASASVVLKTGQPWAIWRIWNEMIKTNQSKAIICEYWQWCYNAFLYRLNRFKCIKCVHCGNTLRRPNQAPIAPEQTCIVCGEVTNVNTDIPLAKLKELSDEAVNLLVHGKWKEGLEKTGATISLASKHFCPPVAEVVEAQIAIWKGLWFNCGNTKHVKLIWRK